MSQSTLHFVAPQDFKARAREALDDPKLRQSFRGAMDFLQGKRQAQFPDADELERLRDLGEAVRQHALANLPDLLVQLEEKLGAAGVQVHWAETADEANRIIHGIAAARQARRVIKGKSMASEEIELNHYLAERGVDCIESDMGEYIVQLAGEKPSHIVMPAIHKTKGDIAALFERHIPDTPYTEDVDALIQTGRRALRQAFVGADIGLSGVNFAAADTGTLWLVENEGNGRLSTTVPDVHIAIMGMEKVVAKLEHIVPLSSLLTRSATGQAITTYFNLISGPRRDGERDGPHEVHLVLLDNGRTQAYADAQLRATLQCIRCGACMNHCPVYTRIGGHAYGTTYPGPIGKIISPHLLGLEATADLPTASSLCGACGEVCPVRIPIPQLLVRLRTEANRDPEERVANPLRGQGAKYSKGEHLVWRFWSGAYSHPATYRMFRWAATRLRALAPSKQMGWTQHRTPLKPAAKSLADLLKEKGQPE
ncbi:LutB/LldF family L-lactate oxidation iron-sulfur protein [Cupriavidus oxalaticus]|uniref:(Fe-S)-binding protein n=1 Tax=Cupriavidus oxalaticus TaxID=96344 RepID=A0A375GFX4_9BURK|nr:LutB/LldF family L-lactate oxidation iron-sulfur protein [Cupriavidus oxalaticus]QRQ84473.1 iron-sulfur cluster-binding protein [Cupriavidus oxalaticus]QRQ91439.1 iron-sulfur cluster-binding protein [Cupriavidus oxalaticus]WQD86003.1 LutB/LldF family L-lactate oxidation iron-sulfur protein [Cupriavidus oxalaticus]SPC19715.1 (Fe-S)-binding protein [Cupriavidus oxalaticus]